MGLAHRDIKPDNIMITEALGLDYIDLASAMPKDSPCADWCSTPVNVPPEVYECYYYEGPAYFGGPVDIFNLGVTLYIILFQTVPFDNDENSDLFY